jgi:hypothetical protein
MSWGEAVALIPCTGPTLREGSLSCAFGALLYGRASAPFGQLRPGPQNYSTTRLQIEVKTKSVTELFQNPSIGGRRDVFHRPAHPSRLLAARTRRAQGQCRF